MILPALQRQPPWAVWLGGTALALGMTAFAYLGLVTPSQARQAEARAVTRAAAETKATAHTLATQLEELHRAIARRTQALETLPVQLGDRDMLNRRIAALIQLAQDQQLEVLQLQPGEPQPGEHYDLLPLKLEADAAFPEHLAFLERLHTAFPDISVVGVELDSRVRETRPRPRVTVAMAWFIAKTLPPASAAAPGPGPATR
ncbi:MAG: type 4a pilus biogenesis protein PilO [Planctomycetota bacterium]